MKLKFNNFPISFSKREKVDHADILPANGHDICNYLARHGLANLQIQTVLKFNGRLDFEKLVQAVNLSVEAEPVLGCRFIEGDPPYWKRTKDIDEARLCSIEEANNMEEAVNRFLESPLDMDKDPMVKVKLIRSGVNDTLCIKINHVCSDGGGAKEYIQLLSEIYSALDQENGTFIPHPRIGGRKDQKKLFHSLGIKNRTAGWKPLKDAPKTFWIFPWKQSRTGSARFVICRLSSDQLDVLSRYGKSKGATINDLLLTAYYRAMFKISQPPYGVPMDITTTIDLRRYIPDQKAEAIRNFSGGFKTSIPRIFGESFEGTLTRVVNKTNKIKSGKPGLQNAIGGECVELMSFPQINAAVKASSRISDLAKLSFVTGSTICSPGLSNLGFVSKSFIKFGENTVTDAYILPPAVRAPGFLLLASTYNGIITLSASYYKGSLRRKDAERLLRKIKDQLVKVCIQEEVK